MCVYHNVTCYAFGGHNSLYRFNRNNQWRYLVQYISVNRQKRWCHDWETRMHNVGGKDYCLVFNNSLLTHSLADLYRQMWNLIFPSVWFSPRTEHHNMTKFLETGEFKASYFTASKGVLYSWHTQEIWALQAWDWSGIQVCIFDIILT